MQIENNEVLVAATDSFVIPCNRLPNSFTLSMWSFKNMSVCYGNCIAWLHLLKYNKKRVKRILLLFVIGRWSYIESNWIDKFKYLSDGIMRNTIYMLTAFRILFLHDFTIFALMLQNFMDFHHQSVPSKWNLVTDVLNVV